jgi:tetratricopeptide (TPR) repeat protein
VITTVKIDGSIADIFDLQDKIVYELTQGLNLKLGSSEIDAIERDDTQSIEAYEYFSRGISNLRMGSRDTLDRAITYFERATELDPAYARAWAALGVAYDLKGSFLSLPELSERAIEYEKKAISLNPRLSHAHQWLAGAYNLIGRFDEAIESAREAIHLDPNNAGAHATLGRVFWLGKGLIDEAITEFQHAITLDPDQGYAYLQLAFLFVLRGDYEKAEAVAREAVAMQERAISGREGLRIVGAHTRLGYAYYCQGRFDEALREYGKEMDFLATSDHALRERTMIELDQKIGAAQWRKGDFDLATRHLDSAIRKFKERAAKGADDPHTKYYAACALALKGDVDDALRQLGESVAALPNINVIRAERDPDLESLRGDSRFQELLAHHRAN